MIIGVTGLSRAGKDVFADILVKSYGFKKMVMSDVLKDELKKRGKKITKENMSLLGDELRKKHGKDIVIRMVIERAGCCGDMVITGFRSPEEVSLAKKLSDFILVCVTAAPNVRFSRRQPNDPQDFDAFFRREERDIKNKGLDKVMSMADYVIENNFRAKSFLYPYVDKLVREIKSNGN